MFIKGNSDEEVVCIFCDGKFLMIAMKNNEKGMLYACTGFMRNVKEVHGNLKKFLYLRFLQVNFYDQITVFCLCILS